MSISMEENLRGKSFNRMKKYPQDQKKIKTAIIRRIDLKIKDKKLRIFYSKGKRIDLSNSTDDFAKILTKLCTNKFKYNDKSPKLERPYDSDLSLYNDDLTYVVFQLSDKNLQFGSRGWPITVADKGYSKDAYFSAQRVFHRQGQTSCDNGDDGDPVLDGCKVAFFIADHGKANIEFTGNYSDAINFHVELVFYDTDGVPRHIPIIIDPDVRYPGGSVDDPGGGRPRHRRSARPRP